MPQRPTPTRLKILRGNPGHRKINGREPQPSAELPICPSWMDAEAKREWNSIIPELSRMNLLSSADRAALAAYCQAYADLASAVKTLRKTGKTIKTEKGNYVQHPAVGQKNRAMLIMGKFLAEFGLSPSSRTRLSVPETNAEEDAMDAFLRGAG